MGRQRGRIKLIFNFQTSLLWFHNQRRLEMIFPYFTNVCIAPACTDKRGNVTDADVQFALGSDLQIQTFG